MKKHFLLSSVTVNVSRSSIEPCWFICLRVSPALSLFLLPALKVIKDRICLRALEKMIHQLADSKEQAEVLAATALQPLDVNADGTHAQLAVTVCVSAFKWATSLACDLFHDQGVEIGRYKSLAVL